MSALKVNYTSQYIYIYTVYNKNFTNGSHCIVTRILPNLISPTARGTLQEVVGRLMDSTKRFSEKLYTYDNYALVKLAKISV